VKPAGVTLSKRSSRLLLLRFAVLALAVLALVAVSHAQFQYNPPELNPLYKMPQQPWQQPRPEIFAWLDIVLLIVALLLAAYSVLVKRSRWGTYAIMAGSLAYFGFYRHGCVCAIGAIGNVTVAIFDHSYALPLVVAAFFLLPLVATLFFGRVFCAAVCPLGALQDIVVVKPIKIPIWLEHALGIFPYVYLGAAVMYAAVGSTLLICSYDPFVSFFRLSGPPTMLLLGGVFLAIGTVVGRPYCRFFCPYSALLRLLAPLAKWRPKITPTTCTQCRLCEEACPFNSIDTPTPAPAEGKRREGKRTLLLLLALLPIVVTGTALLGRAGSPTLAQLDPTVLIAQAVWYDEQNQLATAAKQPLPYPKMTVADQERITAFGRQQAPATELYQRRAVMLAKFRTAGTWFGAWVGLVVCLTLIMLTVRRSRPDYETDPALCVACARCFTFCPYEQQRIDRLQGIEPSDESTT
jgi:NosR/NirI family transcriptional regulator, nitrous oxide reductase regulator